MFWRCPGTKEVERGSKRRGRSCLQSTSPCLAALFSFVQLTFTVARGIEAQRILSLPIILSALMTAPMSDHSFSWDRVLPAPSALLNVNANDLLLRRSSSLLQHHLLPSKHLPESPRDRRSTVPSIAYQVNTRINPINPIPLRASQEFFTSGELATGPLTRKRAASLMADESETRETSPATTHDSNPETTNQFCLCQPDPKIPRPRNGMFFTPSLFWRDRFLIRPFDSLLFSGLCCGWLLTLRVAFILYRQHHQATVVAKHPGLPNPEISKIIGEEWRALPTKTKNQWKALAEVCSTRSDTTYHFMLTISAHRTKSFDTNSSIQITDINHEDLAATATRRLHLP